MKGGKRGNRALLASQGTPLSLFVPKKELGPRLGHELPRQRSSNVLTSKRFLATHEATQAEYNDANE